MNQELIKNVMDIFEKANIKKLSIDSKELKISLSKNNKIVMPVVPPANIIKPAVVQQDVMVEKDTSTIVKADSVGYFNPMITQKDIKAKMKITKGTSIYSITSMNIAHDKKIEKDCIIIEFLVTKGTPVEYGQPVARINEL